MVGQSVEERVTQGSLESVGALIAFGATFSGVYFSFKKESSRRQEEERKEAARKEKEQQEHFARIVQGILIESANNFATLSAIQIVARPGTVFAAELNTDALQAALSDPLFHRWADHSLVIAATIVTTRLAEMNNVLSDYRRHGTMESGDVTVLKIRAGKRQEVIKIMQELLEGAMTKYGAAIVADERTQEINARLKQNLQEEREQLR